MSKRKRGENTWEAVAAWVTAADGLVNPALALGQDRQLRTLSAVAEGDLLLRLPQSTLMTPATAEESANGRAIFAALPSRLL